MLAYPPECMMMPMQDTEDIVDAVLTEIVGSNSSRDRSGRASRLSRGSADGSSPEPLIQLQSPEQSGELAGSAEEQQQSDRPRET